MVTVFAGHPVVRLSKCGLRSDVLGRPLRMGILADVPLLRQGLLASYHLGTQLGHCIGAPRNAEVGQGSRRPSIGYVLAAIFIVGGEAISAGGFRRQVFVGLGKRHVVNSYRGTEMSGGFVTYLWPPSVRCPSVGLALGLAWNRLWRCLTSRFWFWASTPIPACTR